MRRLARFMTILSLGVTTPALAAPEATATASSPHVDAERATRRKEAALRYDRALRLFEDGDAKLALVEFRRAYELDPDYHVLYNIGTVLYRLGEFAEARRTYERYLAEGGAAVGENRRAEVKSALEALEIRTATLLVDADIAGADIAVDGELVGRSPLPPILVDSGSHKVTASKAGHVSITRIVTLAGAEQQPVRLVLAPEQPKLATSAPATLSASTVGWIITGTLAATTAGVGTYTLARWSAAENALEQVRSRPTTRPELETATRDVDSSKQSFYVYTLGATALTALAAGVSLYLTLRSPQSRTTYVAAGPARAALELHF